MINNNNNNTSNKINKFILYIKEFDKFDTDGNPICRNNNCFNKVCKPFRKYCSRKCSREFSKWYNSNFYWRNIRNSVLKRDNYTCQICGIRLHKKKRNNKNTNNWLECDHIIPKSYFSYLGYSFDSLENKIKTILEFLHNKDNLRTLCSICHKQVTSGYKKQKSSLLD